MEKVLDAFSSIKQRENNDLFNLVRDLFITTLIGGVASALNYVFNFVAANRLPEDSFAIFSGVLGLLYLIQIPSSSIQTYFTDLLAKNPNYFKKYNFNDVLRVFIRIGLLVVLLTVASAPLLSSYMQIPIGYLVLAGLTVIGFIYSPIMKGILLGMKKVEQFNLFHLGETVLKLIIFLVALNYSTDPTWPIISFGFPTLLFALLTQAILLWKTDLKASLKIDRQKVKLQYKFMLVTFLTYLFYNSAFSLDVILINPENRAPYAALALLGKIVYFASIIAGTVLSSYFSKRNARSTRNKYLYIGLALNICISLSIVIVYIFFGDTLAELMFAGKYQEIIPLITPLALGMVFYSTTFTFVNFFLAEHKIFQILLLGFTILTQIILYQVSNESLYDAVRNQVIVYIMMFTLMALYWFGSGRKNKLKE